MKIYRGFDDPALEAVRRCVAIGIFDGVHRAHARILRRVVETAKKMKARSAVITFHPHPKKILSGSSREIPVLLSLEHRLQKIEMLGIQETVVVPFNKAFSKISAETFLEKFVLGKMGARMLAVGHDFCFGAKARGNVAFLRHYARNKKFELFVCKPMKRNGEIISSTVVRQEIEKGNLKKASALLGHPVSIVGTVVRGKSRGKGLGFPTANVDPHHEALPPEGVYAVYGFLHGRKLKGVLHLGPRPTFGESEKTVEVHFLDTHANLYGKKIELIFVKKIRAIRHFKDAAKLQRAILKDIRTARKTLA